MNWTGIGEALISGKYRILQNSRGRYDLWYHAKTAGPITLGRDVEGLQRAKDIADSHHKAGFTGVAIDASARG